jgi:hypothetical protein
MNSPYIHERRRIMGPDKKVKFCQLVRESHSLEEAAEWIDVSIRTVQRERKRDEDFDHEVRLALQATPDPLRLMENAARVHWRAAAWLLERTRPEQFARQPANTARDYQVEAALAMVLEAALAATAPEQRTALYQQVQPACAKAQQYCFPQLGPGGNLKKSKLPPTPLADDESREALRAAIATHQRQAQAAAEKGEPPVEWLRAPVLFGDQPAAPPLSPKTREATLDDATAAATTTSVAPLSLPTCAPRSPAALLSPKTHEATASDATPNEATSEAPTDATTVAEEPVVAIDYNLPIDFNLRYDDFAAAIAALDPGEQALLWNQRLRHYAAKRQALASRKEREATKRQKAAKKRAEASRRRNAA